MELLKSKAHSLGFFLNVSIGELRRDTYLCKGLLRFSLSEMKKPQGVASLALGYVHHWAFIDIIGCGSAIQASLIAFALHDDSARPC